VALNQKMIIHFYKEIGLWEHKSPLMGRLFVHEGVKAVVKRVEFVSDSLLYKVCGRDDNASKILMGKPGRKRLLERHRRR